jgi:hypothetical protein
MAPLSCSGRSGCSCTWSAWSATAMLHAWSPTPHGTWESSPGAQAEQLKSWPNPGGSIMVTPDPSAFTTAAPEGFEPPAPVLLHQGADEQPGAVVGPDRLTELLDVVRQGDLSLVRAIGVDGEEVRPALFVDPDEGESALLVHPPVTTAARTAPSAVLRTRVKARVIMYVDRARRTRRMTVAPRLSRPFRSSRRRASLLTIHPDGTGLRAVHGLGRCYCDPFPAGLAWSPDGTRLAVTRLSDTAGPEPNVAAWVAPRLLVVSRDGRTVRYHGPLAGPLAWQPVQQ